MRLMPTPSKLQVLQAYDRVPIAEIDTDDAAGLESKLVSATRVFRDRKGWLTGRTNASMCSGGWRP